MKPGELRREFTQFSRPRDVIGGGAFAVVLHDSGSPEFAALTISYGHTDLRLQRVEKWRWQKERCLLCPTS